MALINIAEAHELLTDGNVSAVIHFDPDDDPVLNKPGYISFDLFLNNQSISIKNCECKIIISKDGRQLANLQATSAATAYTFTQKGLYTIELTGQGKNNSSLPYFDMKIEQQVQRDTTPISSALPLHGPHLGFTLIAIVVVFFVYLYDRHKSKKRPLI